jgi:hypothetical protein
MMKKIVCFVLAAALIFSFASCSPQAEPSQSAAGTPGDVIGEAAATPDEVSLPPTPEPSPTPFGEAPDSAGTGGILFDIYLQRAEADIDLDGTAERVEFTAGENESTLAINGTAYPIGYAALAQRFAVTDIDTADSILEFAFTDAYYELADGEEACTYLYWWDGTQLYDMGPVVGLKFDGAWRAGLHPADYFDGQGLVQYVTRTTEFTDVWYMGHFLCDGAERTLKEDYYATPPLFDPDPLTLKEYLVLLNKINSDYFKPDYYVIWDYASGYAMLPRSHSDEIVSFIPREGETLRIVRVYGQYWFKLEAADGKKGWLKCVDGKVQGVWQVMRWDAFDLFDGIVIAG